MVKDKVESFLLILILIIVCIYIGKLIVYPLPPKVIQVILLVVFSWGVFIKIELGLYLLLFLSSLIYFLPHFNIGPIRFWAEDILILAILFSWGVRIFLHQEEYQKPPCQGPVLAFILIALLNIFLSEIIFARPFSSTLIILKNFGREWIVYFFLYLAFFNLIKTPRQIEICLFLIISSALLRIFILFFWGEDLEAGRIGGGIKYYSPNVFGLHNVIMMNILFFSILYTPHQGKKLLYLLLASPFLFFLIRTASRSAFLCFIALFFISAFVSKKKKILIFAIPFLILVSFLLPTEVTERFQKTFQPLPETAEGSGIINIFGRKFLPDGSVRLRLGYIRRFPTHLVAFFFFGRGEIGIPVDNNYTAILVAYGFIPLCLFIYILIFFGKNLKRNAERTSVIFLKQLNLNLLAILLLISLFAFASRAFNSPRISILFWILMAMGMKSKKWLQEKRR
jgi:hypothetical protein